MFFQLCMSSNGNFITMLSKNILAKGYVLNSYNLMMF